MRHFNIRPLAGSTVGFDRLLSMLDTANVGSVKASSSYNIERVDENSFRISMAVPGFGIEDLAIETNESVLSIKGEKKEGEEEKDRNFLFRGFSVNNFDHRFQLADNMLVHNASLDKGLLQIDLVREVPEELKPRKVDITVGKFETPKVTEEASN